LLDSTLAHVEQTYVGQIDRQTFALRGSGDLSVRWRIRELLKVRQVFEQVGCFLRRQAG
jgi:hypothetical protein